MRALFMRWMTLLVMLICAALVLLILFNRVLPLTEWNSTALQNFKTIFISIILEAMPQVYVPPDNIRRFVPNQPVLGTLFGCFLGMVFP